jgi:hypothetical protein
MTTNDQEQASANEPDLRWVAPGEEMDVLWTDDQDTPHRIRGRVKGIAFSAGAEGGPTVIIIGTASGDESVYTEDVVGMTPARAES